MKEYLIEISLNDQQEINKAITSLIKFGFDLNTNFTPKKLNIEGDNGKMLKKNYLIKGYLNNDNTKNLLSNSVVANVWKSNGYIPF